MKSCTEIIRALQEKSNYESPNRERLILELAAWLDAPHKDREVGLVLDALQRFGLDSEGSSAIYPSIVRLLKVTKKPEIASSCLQVLSDLLYYHGTLNIDDVLWLVNESREFNNSSRRYKLDKSNLLAQVLTQGRYKEVWPVVNDWVLRILNSSDEEYIDLVAFSLGSKEVAVNKEVLERFGRYVQDNPEKEASEEMAVSLARASNGEAKQYLRRKFNSDVIGKPLIEAAIICKDTGLLNELDRLRQREPELFTDYEEDIEGLRKELNGRTS